MSGENEIKPPWVVFPEMQPADLRATQGAEERWLNEDWWPFWLTITAEDRKAYLIRWNSDAEWRDYLEHYTRTREGFDEETDARDRERYLAERNRTKAVKSNVRQSWFSKFMFRDKR